MDIRNLKQIIEEELREALKANNLKRWDDETPSEKRERLFPGSDDGRKLAMGITETDEEDEEIDYHTIDEPEEELEEKKEKKKNCSPGNPYHNSKGEWTSPEGTAGSWSIANKSKKSGCKKGKARRPSGKKERFVKLPCGRLQIDNPNKKAKNKCKGGTNEGKSWEEKFNLFVEGVDKVDALAASSEHIILPQDPYEQSKKQQKLEALIKKLKRQLAKASKSKSKNCPMSVVDAMEIINSLELSSKGKLKEPQGKDK
ncbi:MAG: hypothetical protein HOI80_00025 [Alphaproteobacteria bacterium]|jgi:hypothetical protein|nr:hypothetical protein [Alphaproteobacteria bacterium]